MMVTNVISFEYLQSLLVPSFSGGHHLHFIDVAFALGALYAIFEVAQVIRRRLKTTALRGPPSSSFVWGVGKALLNSPDTGTVYERWAEKYGGVYEVPSVLGGRIIILCDPKAIAHLYGKEPWTYTATPLQTIATENMVGKGITSALGENHRRQRKAVMPGFSTSSMRDLTSVMYDTAYKAKGTWDSLIESNGGDSAVIEVQAWMNRITLDTIGIASFSHDFGSLDGKPSLVTKVFAAFGNVGGKPLHKVFIVLAQALPWVMRLPTPYTNLLKRLNDAMGEISNALLTKSRKEKEVGTLGEKEEKSILGLLISAESQDGQLHLTREEVTSFAKGLLLAGYEPTSTSLTWALIELCRNPEIQAKLRAELLEFGADLTYDQLANDLPYLDAVVQETLRTHPPVHDSTRMATEDDVMPLSNPIRTRSGKLVDHILVAKGSYLLVPILSMNRSATLWGPDAKEFRPERWVEEDGIPAGAKKVQGHRHLLTFIDGPRICLGKGFAVMEIKVVLSILVRNFVLEFPGGPETVIEMGMNILPRPKVAGEKGNAVPLRVRRFE